MLSFMDADGYARDWAYCLRPVHNWQTPLLWTWSAANVLCNQMRGYISVYGLPRLPELAPHFLLCSIYFVVMGHLVSEWGRAFWWQKPWNYRKLTWRGWDCSPWQTSMKNLACGSKHGQWSRGWEKGFVVFLGKYLYKDLIFQEIQL